MSLGCLLKCLVLGSILLFPPGLVADSPLSPFLQWLSQYSKNAIKPSTTTVPINRPPSNNNGSTGASIHCGLNKYLESDITMQTLPQYTNGSARQNESPWLVRIVGTTNYRWHCDAIIISNRAVLTAASCLGDATHKYLLVVGDHVYGKMDQGETSVIVSKTIIHPSYDKTTKKNDFAILITAIAIQMDRTAVRPICLPTAGDTKDYVGSYLIAVGWSYYGYGSPLRVTTLKKEAGTTLAKPPAECRRLHQQLIGSHLPTVTDDIICAGNATGNLCSIDLGGPIVEYRNGRHFLVGIANTVGNGCSTKSPLPAFFGRVSSVVPWILAQIAAANVLGDLLPSPPPHATPTTTAISSNSWPQIITTTTASRSSQLPITTPSEGNNNERSYNFLSAPDCGITKDESSKVAHRIVGGHDAKISQIPWQVRLLIRGYLCGGTVINKRAILTAAHCIATSDVSLYRAIAGDHSRSAIDAGEQVVEIAKVIVHENYDDDSSRNDFALLITAKDISFSTWSVRPACLPSRKGQHYVGWNATISGWGRMSSDNDMTPVVLQVTTVSIQTKAKCAEAYRSRSWLDPGVEITDEMVCAAAPRKDTCQGDSGGPLTVLDENGRHTLVGVTSFGKGCGSDRYPGVYARVTSVLDWLEAKLSKYLR